MIGSFETRDDALAAAATKLSSVSDLPIEVLSLLSDAVDVTEELPPSATRRKPGGWQRILVGRFAIRAEQINLIETFLVFLKSTTSIVSGIAALSTLVGIPAGSQALADGLHRLYMLYGGIIAKGLLLSPEQFVIVATLRELEIATAEEIRERLGDELDGVDVEAALLQLSRAEEPERGIATKNLAGQWQLDGV